MTANMEDKTLEERFDERWPSEKSKIGDWDKFVLTPTPSAIKAFIKEEVEKALEALGSYSILFATAKREADVQEMKKAVLAKIEEYKQKNL